MPQRASGGSVCTAKMQKGRRAHVATNAMLRALFAVMMFVVCSSEAAQTQPRATPAHGQTSATAVDLSRLGDLGLPLCEKEKSMQTPTLPPPCSDSLDWEGRSYDACHYPTEFRSDQRMMWCTMFLVGRVWVIAHRRPDLKVAVLFLGLLHVAQTCGAFSLAWYAWAL